MADETKISWAHSTKVRARSEVNKAVKRGDLPRPADLPCTDCGQVWRVDLPRHEYDHPRGYDKDHQLDVQPVCKRCHVARDNVKAKQTHCIHGHPFDEVNTGRKPDGTRFCRECRRAFDRTRRTRPEGYWRDLNERRTEYRRAYYKRTHVSRRSHGRAD